MSSKYQRRHASRLASLLIAGFAVAAPVQAATQQTLIRNVRVFDGQNVHERRSVLIDGNRIAEDDYRGLPPASARIVEGEGRTLMPGLIDAHVHAYAGLDDSLLFGVTTVVDMFTAPAATAENRARTKAHANPNQADLHSAGILATAPGGHGTQFGVQVPTLTRADQADNWVAARIAEGSDFIKIVIEPGGAEMGRTLPTLDQATVNALVAAAHKRRRLAVVHTSTKQTARMAIAARADGLVHFFADAPVDRAMLTAMRRQKMFVSPTFAVFEGFAGRAGSRLLLDAPAFAGLLQKEAVRNLDAPVKSDRFQQFAPAMEANIRALRTAGIPILAGSDAPNPGTWLGVSLHRELELLVASGLSAREALVAATSAPAKAYNLVGHGRIKDGAYADLLLVEGNPTLNIAATRSIVEVWKDGQSARALREQRRVQIAATPAIGNAAAPLPKDGWIAQFVAVDGGVRIEAPFGSWSVSTDAMMGGSSTARAALTDEGALRLTGTVTQGSVAQWAGIAWSPGARMMAPANLDVATGIAFRIRGTAKGPGLMGFSEAGGLQPSLLPIQVNSTWREVSIAFADLPKFDPKGATMLLIGAFAPGDSQLKSATFAWSRSKIERAEHWRFHCRRNCEIF